MRRIVALNLSRWAIFHVRTGRSIVGGQNGIDERLPLSQCPRVIGVDSHTIDQECRRANDTSRASVFPRDTCLESDVAVVHAGEKVIFAREAAVGHERGKRIDHLRRRHGNGHVVGPTVLIVEDVAHELKDGVDISMGCVRDNVQALRKDVSADMLRKGEGMDAKVDPCAVGLHKLSSSRPSCLAFSTDRIQEHFDDDVCVSRSAHSVSFGPQWDWHVGRNQRCTYDSQDNESRRELHDASFRNRIRMNTSCDASARSFMLHR